MVEAFPAVRIGEGTTSAKALSPLCRRCGPVGVTTQLARGRIRARHRRKATSIPRRFRPRCRIRRRSPGRNSATDAVPAVATSESVIDAVSCVGLTYAVGRALPFHCTSEDELKSLPATISVKAAAPAAAEAGDTQLIEGVGFMAGVGFEPPPQPFAKKLTTVSTIVARNGRLRSTQDSRASTLPKRAGNLRGVIARSLGPSRYARPTAPVRRLRAALASGCA
jgi:hypothetical protein